jgi:hypothetical protein
LSSCVADSDVPEFSEIAKVEIDQEGTINLNGEVVTIEQLRQEFARLKEVNGAVWYYRENPEAEPHPKAMQVMEAIIESKLPVKLSKKAFD